MKSFWLSFFLAATLTSAAQVDSTGKVDSTGSSHANFSIDGDTRNNYQKISTLPYTSTMHHDDWFLQDGYVTNPLAGKLGNSVFDTVGTAFYKSLLQKNDASSNISFVKRMKVPVFETMPRWKSPNPAAGYDTIFWVDGIYYRDYASGNDPTAFTGSKNNMDPNNWQAATSTVTKKSDIVDVYTHVRTTGINPVKDSVWFFAGISTVSTDGNRFFDIEVFKERFDFDTVTKKFFSAGPVNGHSAWEFDANGKVTSTGDIIIAVAYQPGRAPEIEFRIFVKQSTYDSASAKPAKLVPQTFNIVSGTYDKNVAGTGGYVKIAAKDNNTNWGTGLANYTGNSAADSTQGPPWGTLNTSGAWSENYQQLQFIEIGLNFSRFGMNPFQYVTSFCKSPYSSIIVKSRTSTSFTSNLEDFVLPQSFTVKNAAPFNVTPQVMSCTQNTSNLLFTYQARNYYRLINERGDTLNRDVDFRNAATAADRYLTVNEPGRYRIEATNFQGCPSMETQYVDVVRDAAKPDPSIRIGIQGAQFKLIGDATTAAGALGPSQGYTYLWTGPDGSQLSDYTAKEPLITTYVQGVYSLTVTENRNGCTGTTTTYFAGVLSNKVQLQARANNNQVVLSWNQPDDRQATGYIIERSYDGSTFEKIAQLMATNSGSTLTLTDAHCQQNIAFYRIKTGMRTGSFQISNVVKVNLAERAESATISKRLNNAHVVLENAAGKTATIVVTDISGRLLQKQTLLVQQAQLETSISLPATFMPVIVSVATDGVLLASKKLL